MSKGFSNTMSLSTVGGIGTSASSGSAGAVVSEGSVAAVVSVVSEGATVSEVSVGCAASCRDASLAGSDEHPAAAIQRIKNRIAAAILGTFLFISHTPVLNDF